MQNLLKELTQLLSKDKRFLSDDGKLLKNKVIEASLQLDSKLLKLLLKNKTIKKHFFTLVDSTLVFDKSKFQKFISQKSFLSDSYTAFTNKIGLTVADEFISEGKEVVLSWPFKDCVLEGGQTKEDEKRDEIFWNETLAPDEIDRLLSPKVFTNFKKFDSKGKHKVTDVSLEDNFIIKGNNLLALHSLLSVYRGKIKLICIDPPYNTGNDSFQYNDSFNHSTWLTFIKNRLEISQQLLRDDGIIFINIGDEEVHYLKVLCDQIFYRENFLNTVARVAKTASNLGTHFAPSIDFLLCYAKNINKLNEFNDDVDESLYKKIETEGPRKGEKYRDDVAFYQASQKDLRPNQKYFVKCPDGTLVVPHCTIQDEVQREGDGRWRWTKETYLKNKHLLVFKRTKKSPLVTKDGKKAEWNIYTKSYYSERQESGTKPRNIFLNFINRKGADYIKKLDIDFSYSKPVELVEYLLKIVRPSKGDIILDFFAGSGTTAEAVIRYNSNYNTSLKFVLCEQFDYIESVTINRVKKVVSNDSFVTIELSTFNQKFVDQIAKAKTTKELKQIWETIKKDGFISYKVNPKEIDKNVAEFDQLSLKNQKKFLIEVLDKNHLYVNYSEIDDKDYKISAEDKKLNKKFYSLK